MTSNAPAVRVEGVRKVYEPFPSWLRLLLRSPIKSRVLALDGVSLEIHPGQICAVVGPNGAGKSTLFRILTGLTTPTAGHASILGLDVVRQSAAVRRVIGFMPADDRSILMRHTCMENLLFHGRLQGIPKRRLARRARECLDLVGLGHAADRAGIALSSGMRARLQIARAILHRPPVMILDEPTGALDPMSSHDLLNLIQQLTVEMGLAVLLSSHRIEDIEALHDRVLLLDRGSVVYLGPLNELRAIWDRPRMVLTFKSQAGADKSAALLGNMEGVAIESLADRELIIATERAMGDLLANLNGAIDELAGISNAKMPLRELLTTLLSREHKSQP